MPHIDRDPPCGGPQLLSRLLYFVFEQCTFAEGAKWTYVFSAICILLCCNIGKPSACNHFFEAVASSLRVVGCRV